MSFDKPIRRIAIVGTGVIGASWTAQYLARGLDVVATDPAPNAEDNLRKYVDEAWGQLEEIGLSPGASRDRLSFTKDSGQAFAKADFVQENGPERPDFKMKLFAAIDEATPVDSILASSSSARFDSWTPLVTWIPAGKGLRAVERSLRMSRRSAVASSRLSKNGSLLKCSGTGLAESTLCPLCSRATTARRRGYQQRHPAFGQRRRGIRVARARSVWL